MFQYSLHFLSLIINLHDNADCIQSVYFHGSSFQINMLASILSLLQVQNKI